MSKESQAWLPVARGIAEITDRVRSSYDAPVADGLFLKNNWYGYDASSNVEFLLSSRQSYPALRQATFAAFCAWLIAPDDSKMRKDWITSAVARFLCEHEATISSQSREARFALDAMMRIVNFGPDFYEQIYYPIGGLAAMIKCSSPEQMDRIRAAKSKQVARVLFMMKTIHYIAVNLTDRRANLKPSKEIAVTALKEIGYMNGVPQSLSDTTGKNVWRRYSSSMILLYAASNVIIKTGSNGEYWSFIDLTLKGEIDYDRHVHFITEILGRARFLRDQIAPRASTTIRFALEQANILPISSIETKCPEIRHGAVELRKLATRKSPRRNIL